MWWGQACSCPRCWVVEEARQQCPEDGPWGETLAERLVFRNTVCDGLQKRPPSAAPNGTQKAPSGEPEAPAVLTRPEGSETPHCPLETTLQTRDLVSTSGMTEAQADQGRPAAPGTCPASKAFCCGPRLTLLGAIVLPLLCGILFLTRSLTFPLFCRSAVGRCTGPSATRLFAAGSPGDMLASRSRARGKTGRRGGGVCCSKSRCLETDSPLPTEGAASPCLGRAPVPRRRVLASRSWGGHCSLAAKRGGH